MKKESPPLVRCAVYIRCRCGEEYVLRRKIEKAIRLRAREGWVALARRYDDSDAFSRSMLRPGLTKLIRDIADHRVDRVVVCDTDRLSGISEDLLELFNYYAKFGIKLSFYTPREEEEDANARR